MPSLRNLPRRTTPRSPTTLAAKKLLRPAKKTSTLAKARTPAKARVAADQPKARTIAKARVSAGQTASPWKKRATRNSHWSSQLLKRTGGSPLVLYFENRGPAAIHRSSSTIERTSDYFLSPSFSMGLPSVRHSPLPLQSFLPLVDPQPPLPLQEFWPLQACLSFLLALVAFLPLASSDFLVSSFLAGS